MINHSAGQLQLGGHLLAGWMGSSVHEDHLLLPLPLLLLLPLLPQWLLLQQC
jgi:hypothetical protein